ncbi:HAD family hydrolase [Sphaerisporangium sp. B11E5]|uniref:HAD family hydrolase n=1 Tax=Sphaerisporangium sp. B11E5 TaxID=3153563 RepID=UPI00325CB3F1
MRYHVLACDFDGTLVRRGILADDTLTALERLSRAGVRLVLVTGRELDDLLGVFEHPRLFDLIVAENGAVLYDPGRRIRESLAEPPPPELLERLRAEGVSPLTTGQVIVATREPQDQKALAVIRDLGLELQVIYNKGAVMVLPAGVNKASGLAVALDRMKVSPHNVVAVGDAENDHAFLAAAECGAVVANGLPALKDRADLRLTKEDGAGVAELAEMLLSGELDTLDVARGHVLLGHRDNATEDEGADEGGREVRLPSYGTGVMVAGPSGSGKSTTTTALLERLIETGHQCVVIDPEGDYSEFPGITVLGDADRVPGVDEVLRLLEEPRHSVVVNLIGMQLRHRPAFFTEVFPRLAGLRTRLGHPHWVVVDEAHHLMPAELPEIAVKSAADVGSLLMVTVHPEAVSPAALRLVDTVIAVGKEPSAALEAFARARNLDEPSVAESGTGDLVMWTAGRDQAESLRLVPARAERTRHRRKYAAGTMSEDESFYFTGPERRLRLRARNLHTFVELAEGVDDDTWSHHLGAGDYSRWIRESLGDAGLAGDVAEVEEAGPDDSRQRITSLIEERYTLPAEPASYDPGHDEEDWPEQERPGTGG